MSNSDPFGIEKAKGSSLRIPKVPGKGKQYARRITRGAKTRIHNVSSKGAQNLSSETGTPFGEYNAGQKYARKKARNTSAELGFAVGTIGGGIAGTAVHGAQASKDRRVYNQRQFSKAIKITNLGTKAGKKKRWPKLNPVALGAGTAVGGALGYSTSAVARTSARQDLDTIYNRQERRKAKASAIAKAKKKPELERYTPDRKERVKMRGERAAGFAAGGAGAVLGVKALERSQLPKPYRKLRPYKAKPALIVGGLGAALGASGKLDKEQYRVKKNDPFGISKKDSKLKGAAIAAGGSGALGATAALPRVEHAIVRHKTNKIDTKIANLNASKPVKRPPKNVNGQMMRTTSPKEKIARGVRLKEITGQVDELNRAKKAIKRPHLAGNAKATWAGIAVGAPAVWYGSRHSVSKKETGHRRDVDAGLVGAAAGAGGYQEASYALKPLDRRAERKIASNPRLRTKARDYQNKMRPKNAKAGDAAWRPYFRNYPKDLPGARLKRTLAVTHTGRSGGALTTAAAGAAAIGAAAADRKYLRKPKDAVAKFEQKKPPTNRRIAHQKKAQAGFSLAGGTLGLAALASRGKAGTLTRAAKTSANGPKLLTAAQKWKDRSTGLTTAGAGIGGVGAYNFASYTNAEAKAQAKKKGPVAKMDDPFGVEKGFRDEMKKPWRERGLNVKEEMKKPWSQRGPKVGGLVGRKKAKGNLTPVSKLGPPKFRGHTYSGTEVNEKTGEHKQYSPTHMNVHPKGKSLILRRQKYAFDAYPGEMKGGKDKSQYLQRSPSKMKLAPKSVANEVHAYAQTGSSKEKAIGGLKVKVNHDVKKDAFGVQKREGSGGRDVTAAVFPGWHGAVAGKKGRKVRSFANETAGTVLGGTGGAIVGGALTGGRATGVGAGVGAMAGSVAGSRRNQKKGYLKPIKKNAGSAFGIVHE